MLKLCDTVREKLDELHADCNKWELPDDVNIDDLPKKIEESKVLLFFRALNCLTLTAKLLLG